MRAAEIIMKKRGFFVRQNGKAVLTGNTELSKEEIKFMIDGYVSSSIPDYQISAFLMAVYFNGMTFNETAFLTECMLHSGAVLNLKDSNFPFLTGPFVDKHSTGGVGDKISLPLAPIVACCGVQVPMMSGRALGYTGGTLDKLDSINGYRTSLTPDEFKSFISKTGYAMTGQTKEIVPADRLMYALRDVTGTVESIPLITASILSKKIAEGASSLLFDVKCGTGAFMKSFEDAESLALSLVKTAKNMGKDVCALITDMNTPLGIKTGNFLEIEETLDCLKGNGPKDVMEEVFAFASEMILLAKKATSYDEALKMAQNAVSSGKAYEKFMQNVTDQGGSPSELENQYGKRRSPFKTELKAKESGYIFIDAYKTGLAGITLGVGRNKTSDSVCAEAGIIFNAVSGTFVKKGDLIMEIYGKDNNSVQEGLNQLENAVSYTEDKNLYSKKSMIIKTIR